MRSEELFFVERASLLLRYKHLFAPKRSEKVVDSQPPHLIQ